MKLPVLDRLLTPEFRDRRPDLAFLFQQMGTFNTAKMADLRNLGSDGPTGAPHSMYWETPSLFNDAVGRFLADVTAAGVTRG